MTEVCSAQEGGPSSQKLTGVALFKTICTFSGRISITTPEFYWAKIWVLKYVFEL